MTSRIVIVSDQRLFGEALRDTLESQELVGVELVIWPADVVGAIQSKPTDLVLLHLDESSMFELGSSILVSEPSSKVVGLGATLDHDTAVRARDLNFDGFLTTSLSASHFLATLRAICAGNIVFPRTDLATQSAASKPVVTRRELEILGLLAEGLGTESIAERLFISPHTVRTHVKSLLPKLGARSRLEAVHVAIRLGVLRFPGALR